MQSDWGSGVIAQFEQFSQLIGNQADIWYATNSEIVSYMNAIRQLRCSVSGYIVHNPSAISIIYKIILEGYSYAGTNKEPA